MSAKQLLGIAVIGPIVAAATLACGDPAGPTTEPELFVFTPVPYVTTVYRDGPTMLEVVDERGCPEYTADIVMVTVKRDERDQFIDWLDSSSFEFQYWIGDDSRYDDPRYDHIPLIAIVGVPPGSVNDALRFVEGRPGVRRVDRSGYAFGLESPCLR